MKYYNSNETANILCIIFNLLSLYYITKYMVYDIHNIYVYLYLCTCIIFIKIFKIVCKLKKYSLKQCCKMVGKFMMLK